MTEKIKVQGKGIAPMVDELYVRRPTGTQYGSGVYNADILDIGEIYKVIAIGQYQYEDKSYTNVAYLDVKGGMIPIALERLEVVGTPKPATVEVCHTTRDRYYRCPHCDTLNINQGKNEVCPDCGNAITYPEITVCPCQGLDNE